PCCDEGNANRKSVILQAPTPTFYQGKIHAAVGEVAALLAKNANTSLRLSPGPGAAEAMPTANNVKTIAITEDEVLVMSGALWAAARMSNAVATVQTASRVQRLLVV